LEEHGQFFSLVAKIDTSTSMSMILRALQPMLEEFKKIILEDLLEGMPPMRDIQHHTHFVSGASLQNPPRY
jgi:hypothetical protein